VLSTISEYHVGNVILTGRSAAGVAATRSVTAALQAHATAAATDKVPLFVATDQEGGQVQVLSGPGFSTIPEALTQGTWSTSTLRSRARTWGGQLAAAGVNLDLAPVMDTVPLGQNNPPIGGFDREFGHTTGTVGAHGTAFSEGMQQAGVAVTVKHFPGLGRVAENTDTNSDVTDHVTTYHDAFLSPFRQAIRAGAAFAMMSTAFYSRIDAAHPAAFSSTIVGGMLRGDMGFRGVVISDDLGGAAQVASWSPGARAVDFLHAGGDMVLTVTPDVLPAMVHAVETAAARDARFRARVDTAALRVLTAKQAQGLLPTAAITADFTGDGRTEAAVWRPATGTWYVRGADGVQWGAPGDVPVPTDYDGDGRADLAVWRPSSGTWYVRGAGSVRWGAPGDIPVPRDYNGDRMSELAVWRPSSGTWYVRGVGGVQWGAPGDIPAAGDYNADGSADLAVWRPSDGTWYIRRIADVQWGRRGDVPV
jgi:beta-glucosidase-like glycosyl hydrolase